MRFQHILCVTALLFAVGSSNAFAQTKHHSSAAAKPPATASSLITSIAAKKDPRINPAYLQSLYSDAWFTVGEMYWDDSKLTNWGAWEHKFDGKLNTEQDLDEALSQMVESLHDQWTTYDSSHKRLLQAFASVRGIVDFGLLFKLDENGDYIVTLAPYGSPARDAGLQPGDKLISVKQTALRALSPDQVGELLQTTGRSDVPLTIFEAGATAEKTILVRASPAEHPKAEAKMLPGGILYARHSSFLEGETNGLFNEAVSKTIEQAGTVNGMILDLRGNPGGQFELVQKELAFFLPDKVIVQSITREGNLTTTSTIRAAKLVPFEYNMLPDRHKKMIDVFTNVPLVVLVDGSTASAAEIMSAALQDNGRAILVGQHTYKKGVGFREVDVPLGGQLTITNLKYFTPSGADVSNGGVKPQVEVSQPRDGTDKQLEVGLEVLQKRIQESQKN